jgi:hypothetical protein
VYSNIRRGVVDVLRPNGYKLKESKKKKKLKFRHN